MKKKGPTHDDRAQHADRIEARRYTVKREGLEPPSSVVHYIDCPFCHQEVKAYLWSISGSGKRCQCGAMLSRLGNAYHWKETTQ
mgnify:FL=1